MKILDEAYISRVLRCSNTSNDQNFKSLSEAMKVDASRATRIQVVSGYFGAAYVLELLQQIPTKKARSNCAVTLIFGYDSTTELFNAQTRTSELKDRIIKLGFKDINIKLFKDAAPLHTKLYNFLIKTHPIWYIGSANLSKAIEGDRHELMVRVTGKSHAFNTYIQALLAHGSDKKSIANQEIIGITRFLSAGYILFRPSRHRRFTYDGFVIKSYDRQKISKQLGRGSKVPHSDPSAEGFGFDLLSAIGITSLAKNERHIVKVRPYCVETAYGYWVPTVYKHEIELKIDKDEESQKKKFIIIRDALAKITDDKLISEFQAYLEASEKFFDQIGVSAKPKKDILDSFVAFLSVRRRWLQDDEWIKRNSSKLFLTEMPDIWNDTRATESFITSFCEDICSVLNSPERKPKIYRKISDNLHLNDSPTADEIKSNLELARGAFWE